MQEALDAREFNGDLSFIGKHQTPEELRLLARRAQAALDAYNSESSEGEGGDGTNSNRENGNSSSGGEDDIDRREPKRQRTTGGGGGYRGRNGSGNSGGRRQEPVVRTNIWWPDEIGILRDIPPEELEVERALREVAMRQLTDYYAAMERFNEQECEGGGAAGNPAPRPERPKMSQCRIWANGCWNKRLFNHRHKQRNTLFSRGSRVK